MFSRNQKTKTTQNFVRSVINDHLPESVLAKIQNGGQIYRLTFTGEETGQPVLSYIAKNYNVDVNVLYGNIIELQNVLFGNLLVELQGEQREIQKSITTSKTASAAEGGRSSCELIGVYFGRAY